MGKDGRKQRWVPLGPSTEQHSQRTQVNVSFPGGLGEGPGPVPQVPIGRAYPIPLRGSAATNPKPEMQVSLPQP